MDHKLYLGCYTNQNNTADSLPAEGIYLIDITEDGKIEDLPSLICRQNSPTYFYLSEDKKRLYAVSEPGPEGKGAMFAYHIGEGGKLELFSQREAAGMGLCHVNLDAGEKNMVVVSYPEASVQVYPLSEDGSIQPMFCLRRHTGSGPVTGRQEAAHAHSATFSPDGEYMFVCDLGTDEIVAYHLLAENGKLHRAHGKNVICPAGSGPRHMTFSPNGRFAYVACELNNEVLTLSYDREEGLTIQERTNTLSPDFDVEVNYPSAIRITRDGKHLYVSNRGEDTIAHFTVDPETGRPEHQQSYSTMGWYPRDFILTEDETLLIAVNQLSDNMVVFRRTEDGGLVMTDTGSVHHRPVALMEL